MRARAYGITIGDGTPGPQNAITDVTGVRVGHCTLFEGSGPLVVGRGPVRTGVTVIIPPGRVWEQPVFAGAHRLNGNGEMTGLEWVRESGMLTTPVGLTNTHSVGVVRDALLAEVLATDPGRGSEWSLPVVARRGTACSTTSTAFTSGPSTCTTRSRGRATARFGKERSAAAPG